MGINEVFFNDEKHQQKEYLRSILERKKSAEITSLEAAQFLEIEGIPIPTTYYWKLSNCKVAPIPEDILPQNAITREMTLEEAAEAYQKLMG